ncbi:unnamed protein product, partial [Cladocopium goreaui]
WRSLAPCRPHVLRGGTDLMRQVSDAEFPLAPEEKMKQRLRPYPGRSRFNMTLEPQNAAGTAVNLSDQEFRAAGSAVFLAHRLALDGPKNKSLESQGTLPTIDSWSGEKGNSWGSFDERVQHFNRATPSEFTQQLRDDFGLRDNTIAGAGGIAWPANQARQAWTGLPVTPVKLLNLDS